MKKIAYTFEFFHGTSSKFLQRIMKEGLSSSPRERVWDEERQREPGEVGLASYPGAYVSNNFELAYVAAEAAVKRFEGNLLIVMGRVETRSPEARLDEDHVQEPGAAIAIQDKLVGDWYRNIKILNHYAFDADDTALRDASRIWVEKALKIKPTEEVMNKSVVALRAWLDMRVALELEREGSGGIPSSGIAGELKRRFGGNIPKKYMDAQNTIQSYKKAMDEFLAKAKELLDRKTREHVLTNVRLTKPISYKGSNKIEAIIEIDNQEDPAQITIHYAASRSAVGSMLAAYQNHIGASFEVK